VISFRSAADLQSLLRHVNHLSLSK